MPFAFKAAPGVHIHASGAGVRTSINAAGINAAGRLTDPGRAGFAPDYRRAPSVPSKEEQADQLRAAMDELLNRHRREFPPARAPEAPPPPEVNAASVAARHRKQALAGLGPFQRTRRRHARADARVAADHEIGQLESECHHLHRHLQQRLDRGWQRLLRNDPATVLSALTEAFGDNEAPAAAVGVVGSEVSLVTVVPGAEAMPERQPGWTAAGNLTLTKLTQTQRGALHATTTAAHVLLTVREAFAVAPGLRSARVLALRHTGADSYGKPRIAPIMATRLERGRLEGVQWQRAGAAEILQDASSELLTRTRRGTATLLALDLRGEPQLGAFLATVRVD